VHNWLGVYVQVADPEVVQEMMTTKNAQIDKTGLHEALFKNLFGNSFLFSKTDEHWKRKRKGLRHAFFKDKLIVLLDKLNKYMKSA